MLYVLNDEGQVAVINNEENVAIEVNKILKILSSNVVEFTREINFDLFPHLDKNHSKISYEKFVFGKYKLMKNIWQLTLEVRYGEKMIFNSIDSVNVHCHENDIYKVEFVNELSKSNNIKWTLETIQGA